MASARRSEVEQLDLPANAQMMRPGPEARLLGELVGTWDVEQRVWAAAGADPLLLPPMVAERRLIGDAYLEEDLEPKPGSEQEPFTRLAFLFFNLTIRRFEYVSMDTRFPGIMFERSFDEGCDNDTIALDIDMFVLPGFGSELTAQAVKQRRLLTMQDADTTTVKQYWTACAQPEYLAVEYIYRRR
jgi:hypothetical protein